ncbi:hypothetical protein C8J57DRAFT_1671456 [Mycena rebaudengoi]|nr:hypothetical protein C8J57DRAFT_1671456 [Mycena rebaudengoi]
MATPSTPSPTMALALPPQQAQAAHQDPVEQDHRKKAVEKFKARAEISNVTRSLRARLSYASYKAAHNIPHVPLRDLEAQSLSQAQSFSRNMAARRKATTSYQPNLGTNNYYNNPATQGGGNVGPSALPLRRGGSMAPPPNMGPRTYYPSALNGAPNAAATGSGSDLSRPPLAHNLFTSILAPPPSHQARTILNVSDPPVPAPSRPPASPRARPGKPSSSRSIAEGTRAMAKSRRDDKPDKRKAKRSLEKGKQKQRRHGVDVDADGDVDMKAAATLTSLLLHHRPSIGSASSPRSSLDESETGSTQSYSHFAQSSARNIGSSAPPPSNAPSTSTAVPEFRRASATPPPSQPTQQTTPRPAPTDNEAADLMLFLATSPSPVRKDSKDLAAYRALNGAGAGLRAKGRVLFPTAGAGADAPGGGGVGLARGTAESFTSSVSSIGSEMRGGSRTATPVPSAPSPAPPSTGMGVGGGPASAPTTYAPTPRPAQLLPPPPLPGTAPVSAVPSPSPNLNLNPNLNVGPGLRKESPRPVYGQPLPPQQPQQVDFNFNDFLNSSPSPSRGGAGAPAGAAAVAKQQQHQNLGLRADVGRKLFEEEQMRHAAHGGAGKRERPDERGLGAGIDLVQS